MLPVPMIPSRSTAHWAWPRCTASTSGSWTEEGAYSQRDPIHGSATAISKTLQAA